MGAKVRGFLVIPSNLVIIHTMLVKFLYLKVTETWEPKSVDFSPSFSHTEVRCSLHHCWGSDCVNRPFLFSCCHAKHFDCVNPLLPSVIYMAISQNFDFNPFVLGFFFALFFVAYLKIGSFHLPTHRHDAHRIFFFFFEDPFLN